MKVDREGFQADEMKASSVNQSANLNGGEAAWSPKNVRLAAARRAADAAESQNRLCTVRGSKRRKQHRLCVSTVVLQSLLMFRAHLLNELMHI